MDKLIICPRCTSDACYEISEGINTIWSCFGCGFYSNDSMCFGDVEYEQHVPVLPELHKDLRYVDEKGFCWFPKTVNISNKGMVFADGNSISDWKWAAVLAVPLDKKEKKKHSKITHKMDMRTVKYYDEKDFMDALEYIGFFEN